MLINNDMRSVNLHHCIGTLACTLLGDEVQRPELFASCQAH